jgi:hypothetical protein
MLPSDEKELARLVRKYGRDTVVASAMKITVRSPGLPVKISNYLDRTYLADWIAQYAKEYRQAGYRNPIQRAESDLFQIIFDKAATQQEVRLDKWPMSSKRFQGRRMAQELKKRLLELKKRLRKQK